MSVKWAIIMGFSLGLASSLPAQRAPLARSQLPAPAHDHTERVRDIGLAQRNLGSHGAFVRRMIGDHAFADQVEAAAATGDFQRVAALFAQATGVPIGNVQVGPLSARTLGAAESEPDLRWQETTLRTRNGFVRWTDALTHFCLFGFCISLERAERQ